MAEGACSGAVGPSWATEGPGYLISARSREPAMLPKPQNSVPDVLPGGFVLSQNVRTHRTGPSGASGQGPRLTDKLKPEEGSRLPEGLSVESDQVAGPCWDFVFCPIPSPRSYLARVRSSPGKGRPKKGAAAPEARGVGTMLGGPCLSPPESLGELPASSHQWAEQPSQAEGTNLKPSLGSAKG